MAILMWKVEHTSKLAPEKAANVRPPRRPTSPDGLIVVDKPSGVTSHDVVSQVRRLCGTRAVGHGGTLDPMATGVLVCGVGKGTKLLTYISGAAKTYEATIRLGIGTNSDDADGEVVATPGTSNVELSALNQAIAELTGELMQVPNTVSAIKVDGERAYALARQGKDVALKARPITVQKFLVNKITENEIGGIPVIDIDATITVSSGTYIRALARDLGLALGTAGHLTRLRRTWIGGKTGRGFDITDAIPLTQLQKNGDGALANGQPLPTMPLADGAARFLPTRQLNDSDAHDVVFGRFITASGENGVVAAVNSANELVALLTDMKQKGQLRARPLVVFTEPVTQNQAHRGDNDSELRSQSRPTVSAVPCSENTLAPRNEDTPSRSEGTVLTFGSFDGVQRGHQALLNEVIRIAKDRGLKSLAITFDPHPGIFHKSRPGLQLIQGVTQRVQTLRAHGIDDVVVIPYTEEFAAQPPEAFVRDYLVNQYHAKTIVLGSDARFGAKRHGDLTLLRQLGAQYGFDVVEFHNVGPQNSANRWSSTDVRKAIAQGDVATAAAMLGRPHTISGQVVHGAHRGRTLGYPTANLGSIVGYVPADGVYAGWLIDVTGQRLPAAISIGTNPTFADTGQHYVEAYVLDRADLELYGQQVQLEFAAHLRPTVKFDSVDALLNQMQKDVAQTRVITAKTTTEPVD